MTAKNRAGLITKLHTSLKKHYKPAPAAPGRPLLEHILYAALLEDAPVDLADEGFAKCEQEFFDWNEVRVTSVTELAEVLVRFPSPPTTSARLKRCLQCVFEGFYNFDIDHLKKENLGKAVAKFEAMSGISPFVLAYLVQHGLGGHAIPVNSAAMHIMLKAGIVTESEARTAKVPGLERAIPKSKAIEFSSMLHQAAVALQADPLDKTVWEVILSVNKDAEVSPPKKQVRQKSAKRPLAKADTSAQTAIAETPSTKADSKSKAKAKPKVKATGDLKTAEAAKAAAASAPAKSSPKPSKATKPAAGKTDTEGAAATPGSQGSGKAGSTAKTAPKSASPASTPATTSAGGSSAAKKPATKAPKKPGAGKTSSSAKPAAGKGSPKATDASAPSAGGTVSGEAKKAEGSAVSGGNGNQTLTKQKPR